MTARGSLVIAVTAILAGVVIGFVGGAFRWCLQTAERLRLDLVDWAHQLPGPGWLIPVAAAAAGAALAALIVRRQPLAAGSGIQHVEAVYHGHARPPLIGLMFGKFVGGVLAIGSGMVLGREGPTVHMGAAVGAQAARGARLGDADIRMMQTAVGGAGLAVAFNAPIAGVLFAVEEVTKAFRLQMVLATTLASATAVGCSRLILGNHPDFAVARMAAPALAWLPLFLVFGVLTGLLGAVYNQTVLWFLDHVTAVARIPAIVKATVIGALVGLASVVVPLSVGDGQTLTQLLLGGHTLVLALVAGYLAIRFVAGPLCYSAALPGGLFAPLLAVGALWGVLFVGVFGLVWPHDVTSLAIPVAIVGMAAFFSATVRAPVTGMVIVIEMTATTSVTVPMLGATAAAVLAAQLVGSPPIYDSLRERMVPERPAGGAPDDQDGQ
ncbi:ClC family H(+)/Cl(-) exchange transporter [Mycolicibacterium chubuense]|uniref:H(+)/Cl(-) exchange transporter ClcA n=1 Tax=Mycolicibacterium chubuense TaxID=1800 RepID=A0A0J6YM56_MYCCU|nr:ClC family H(+)/Cl(-) exchange transporter [Mycolicibacterium chubuense]KMO73841.1 H(+)/Cl(-) exchange transporter ClcA [Mycolicibacterium chubuense]SPX97643.1 chloride channel protein EriC [Mycolicibacterium chubuense]